MQPDQLLAGALPQATEAYAERVADDVFGLRGRARRLTSERDLNFALTAEDGSVRVLKFANAGEASGVLDFQLSALEHIRARDPAIPVPRVIRTLDGQALAERPDEHGRPHRVFMLDYLSGRPLATVTDGPGAAAERSVQVGTMLARLDAALDGFDHPAADRALLWDLSRASDLRRYLGHIADPALRRLVSDGLDRFDAQALPVLPGLRRQVIHNDLNPHNIIVAEAPASHITGIIDFGDMVRAPLVNDLATAASYHVAQGKGPLGNALPAIRAYHAVRPLEAAEIDLLPLLIATRNILTLAITAWRASLYPDNRDYILRNVPAATAALRKLADLGQEPAADLIRQACRQEPAR